MTTLQKLLFLNHFLLTEMPQYQEQSKDFLCNESDQHTLFRSLINLRPLLPVSADFLHVQDDYLQAETRRKGIVSVASLSQCKPNISLWQGDITRLDAEGIVNAANNALLGCFVPCHGCIDNAIHSYAGVQLRLACHDLMQIQRHAEETGTAKFTAAFNLPSRFVIHTVGPIVRGALMQHDCDQLARCYRSCLNVAIEQNMQSIAFCCISTGEFGFPNEKACQIAVDTVTQVLQQTSNNIKVIFNVFKDQDYQYYQKHLG